MVVTMPELGEMCFTGNVNWDTINRNKAPKGTAAKVELPLTCEPARVDILLKLGVEKAVTGPNSCHSVVITESSVLVWGRNSNGQLGLGDITVRTGPKVLQSIKQKVVDAATGRNHTLFVTEDGQVFACGDNKMGQCGQPNLVEAITTPRPVKGFGGNGAKAIKVCCGADFSFVIDSDGKLWSFGSPEYSQLGLGKTHEFLDGRKSGFTPQNVPAIVKRFGSQKIADIACGANHAAAVTSEKKLYTWGFGGYGRLGHNDNKDQYYPQEISFFSKPGMGIVHVACGNACTAVVSESGQYYLWGKWKTTGDGGQGTPWMYPRPVHDLSGLAIRSISCGNQSLFVVTDSGVVAWGQNCANGELGLGANGGKSLTKPDYIRSMEGGHFYRATAGCGHCLLLASPDSEKLKEMEILQLSNIEDKPPVESEKRKGAPAKGGPGRKRTKA
eukprot:Nk52_evm50s352 gene=Nk52_evmTU50s352